jgi:hypothetical protein
VYECLVTSFVFSIVDILGLAAPELFFSSQSFHFVTNILSSLNSAFMIFCCTQTHTWLLEVIILFSNWYQSLVHSV